MPSRRPPNRAGCICSIGPTASRCFPIEYRRVSRQRCAGRSGRRNAAASHQAGALRPADADRRYAVQPHSRGSRTGRWRQFRKFRSEGQFVPFERRERNGRFSRASTAARNGAARRSIRKPDSCTSTRTMSRGPPVSPKTDGGNSARQTVSDQLRQLPRRRSERRAAADSRADGLRGKRSARADRRDHPARRRPHAVLPESAATAMSTAMVAVRSERRKQGTGDQRTSAVAIRSTGSPDITSFSIPTAIPRSRRPGAR